MRRQSVLIVRHNCRYPFATQETQQLDANEEECQREETDTAAASVAGAERNHKGKTLIRFIFCLGTRYKLRGQEARLPPSHELKPESNN